MRWVLSILLICNGIFFLWQGYLQPTVGSQAAAVDTPQDYSGSELILLAESDRADPYPLSITPEPVEVDREVEPAAIEGPEMCWLVGPFKEQVGAKQVVSRLASAGLTFTLRDFEVAGKPDYWVHIPPLPTRKLALKRLRELQAKKIDSFLIADGELENGISLGFFTLRQSAEKIHKARKKQGYEAKIKEVARVRVESWLVSEPGEYSKYSDELWQSTSIGVKDLERRKNICNKIASVNNFD